MISFQRLDHILICIPPGTEEQARQFYTGIIGLEEIPGNHPKGAMWFKLADIELHIRAENPTGRSDRHPAFEISDLKAAEEYLISKNVPLSYSSEIDGRQRLFFRDPFDNRIELLEF